MRTRQETHQYGHIATERSDEQSSYTLATERCTLRRSAPRVRSRSAVFAINQLRNNIYKSRNGFITRIQNTYDTTVQAIRMRGGIRRGSLHRGMGAVPVSTTVR